MKNNKGNVLGALFKRNLSFDEQEKMRSEGEKPNGKNKLISSDEAKDYVKLSGDVNIFLDGKLLEGDSKELTSILGHEFGHAAFSANFTATAWLWSLIGDIQKQGHDLNNPNGKAADFEEKKTRDGIK